MNINKKKNIILIVSLLIALFLALLLLINTNSKKKNIKHNEEKFVSQKIDLPFQSRVDKLNEFDSGKYLKFGWLQIQGTHMDLPILSYISSEDEDEIEYSYGWMSSGYITGENRPVIMGHNILNVSNEPMPPNDTLQNFEELMAFTYYGFAKENLYVQFTTDNDDVYLITYWFSAEDGKTHYISIEGKKEINGVKLTDYMYIPESFSLNK